MFKMLYPYEYVESVFSIDYNKLKSKGYKAIIFDIDNTLVPHGKDTTKEVDELFEYIHSIGLKTLFLSDNSEERIEKFNRKIKTQYIANSEKPKVGNFLKAVKLLNVKKEEVVYIGDQIFKDIYGANKSGLDNILVKYIRVL